MTILREEEVKVVTNDTAQAAVKQPLLEQLDIKDGENADEQRSPPKDKFFLVYAVMLLFGLASLLPWNIFITATSYFVDYKLNTNSSMNAAYRRDFTFYVGLIGQTTNVFMNLLNICITFGG
jgi:equilibrative nucleoside transporter 1/2/3